jgi:predicted exporter
VRNPEALAARLAPIEGALFLDQSTTLREAYATYQARTVRWLGLGLLGVLLLLALRYRDLRTTLATFVPAVLACGVTLAVLSWLGYPIDMVVLTALLMVVSMGVDYGVFLADAESPSADHRAIALLSVALAAVSTVLGFGLLALSEHPLLSAIGVTSAVGMVASVLLAPAAIVLRGARRLPVGKTPEGVET